MVSVGAAKESGFGALSWPLSGTPNWQLPGVQGGPDSLLSLNMDLLHLWYPGSFMSLGERVSPSVFSSGMS